MTSLYERRAQDVREAPTSFLGRVRYLGPGLIVVGSIVGSGELITTTALGAQVGFACLWLLLLSCLTKTIIMEELGRFTLSTGQTCLDAFNDLPGPSREVGRTRRRVGWFLYLWLITAIPGIVTGGGIIGGVGQVMNIALPMTGTGFLSGDRVWAVIMFAVTMALIQSGRYEIIQTLSTIMVLTFTAATIVCAIALQWTEFAISWTDVTEGLKFKLPGEALFLALGAYGGTGATANESMAYTYWCLEKGFARFVGKPEPTAPWVYRARGWVRVMHFDVINVMVIFTLATVAFYFLGAAVLKPMIARGDILLKPGSSFIDGSTTMASLSHMYTETLGTWAHWLFLMGAFSVLYSTVISGWAGGGRFWADMLGVIGVIDSTDYATRLRYIRIFSVALPALTTIAYLVIGKVVILLAIGGTISTLMTPIVAMGTVYLRHTRTDARIAPTRKGDVVLWVCTALITAFTPFALWQTWQSLGK